MRKILNALSKVRVLDIDKAINIFGVSFSDINSHPIVATLMEYRSNPALKYQESQLYRYHTEFCPNDTFQAFNINASHGDLPLFVYPWGAFRKNYNEDKDVTKSRFCGPSSDDFILHEFNHIISLYESILSNGYSILKWANVLAGTYLIDRSGQYRFVVLQGNHRISVLAALGKTKVLVRTMPGYCEKVEEIKSNNWENVVNGRCEIAMAEQIFSQFFDKENSSRN